MIAIQPGLAVNTFDAVASSAPLVGEEFAIPARAGALMWQTFFGTNPAAISIELQFSLDGTHWDAIDVSTVIEGEIRSFAGIGGAPGFVRGRIASITGGDDITMTIVWTVY